jgi:hypothetical protein
MTSRKVFTLVFIRHVKDVLLGMKKRGFAKEWPPKLPHNGRQILIRP